MSPPTPSIHACLQSEIAASKMTGHGPDLCRPGRPARLTSDKVRTHYVIHYLHRGLFDDLVPELEDGERENVVALECGLCGKRFRNRPERREFPARGSLICHLATEHGKIAKV